MESIFRELGVKVIWYEDFDELPELIEKVFGLNVGKTSDDKSLIQQTESKIGEIQSIEDGLKGFQTLIRQMKMSRNTYSTSMIMQKNIETLFLMLVIF